MKNRFRMKKKYFFLYTLLFAITACVVFGWLLFHGKSFCWKEDAMAQYIPKVYYYIVHGHEFFKNILSGHMSLQMYDFSIGFGDMVPLHLEPVYWLYLLTDESNIEIMFDMIMVFRFYLGGLACFALLLYFDTEEYAAILGGLIYVFSGYPTMAVLWHNQFMIPMILLPLLIMAMEELLWKKKWYYFTILVWISFWCGYYFTFMNTIALGVYYIVRFLCTREERTVKEFFIKGIRISYAYIIGIMIANVTFFTSFSAYLNSSRTTSEKIMPDSLLRYESGWISSLFRSFLVSGTAPGHWVHLGFISVCYFAVTLLFIKRGKLYLNLKALLAAFTAGLLIPAFGYVMSGFSNGNNRWSYVYTLVIAVITARMIPELIRITKKQALYLFISGIPYWVYAYGRLRVTGEVNRTVQAALLLFASYVIIVLISLMPQKRMLAKKAIMSILVIASLSILAQSLYDISQYAMEEDMIAQGEVYNLMTDTPLKAASEIEDDSFYRVATYNNKSTNQGASMILGYNGTVYFNSTINGNILDFYRELGLTTFTLVKVRDLDERAMLNSLLSVKYLLLDKKISVDKMFGYRYLKDVEVDGKTISIYENEYVLPFGVTYDQTISVDELEQYESAQRSEVMLQAAAIEKEEYVSANNDIGLTGKKLDFAIDTEHTENVEFEEHKITAKKGGSITFTFDADANSELYLFFRNMSFDSSKKRGLSWKCAENSGHYTYRGDSNVYGTGQDDYIINMNYSDKERSSCTITFEAKCTFEFDEFCIYEQPMDQMQTYTAALTEEKLENVQMRDNKICGDITVSKDKLLVVNIPYQNGWTAYVDGEKTELIKSNLMLTGIYLKAGTHQVEFRYAIPGIRKSLMISALGLLLFAGLYFYQFIYKKNRSNRI